jgi:hypothetical protein
MEDRRPTAPTFAGKPLAPLFRSIQVASDPADARGVTTLADPSTCLTDDVSPFFERPDREERRGPNRVRGEQFSAESAKERRRSRRSEQDVSAWLSPAGSSSRTPGNPGGGGQVRVGDLSLHGVGLISPKPIAEGAAHWMVIAGGALRLSCRVRIVACRQRTDGKYECGGEFY